MVRSGGKWSAVCRVRGGCREKARHGWMDRSPSFLSFIFICFLSVFVAGALAPAASGPQSSPQSVPVSTALCVNVPWGRSWHSALLRPQPSPSQPRPPLWPLALTPMPLHPLCRKSSPAAALTSLRSPLHLLLSLSYSLPASTVLVHSLIRTANQPWTWQSAWPGAHSYRTHKTATRVLCCWSDRLNWVLIEFRYIFIIADNHYTRYLQSLWNITIGIYRNFVQNMPDFNAWIVGSLFSHFWRIKHWPKSHWCLEVL